MGRRGIIHNVKSFSYFSLMCVTIVFQWLMINAYMLCHNLGIDIYAFVSVVLLKLFCFSYWRLNYFLSVLLYPTLSTPNQQKMKVYLIPHAITVVVFATHYCSIHVQYGLGQHVSNYWFMGVRLISNLLMIVIFDQDTCSGLCK